MKHNVLISFILITLGIVNGCSQKPEFGSGDGSFHAASMTRAGTFPTSGFPEAKEVKESEVITDETLGNVKTYIFKGKLGVAATGGPLVGSADNKIPWDRPMGSERTLVIPEGARIKTALLYYTGPMARETGDFTPEDGLNTNEDVLNNTITFQINGEAYGPFGPNTAGPDKSLRSEVGPSSRVTMGTKLTFGTLTGVHGSMWSNRIDIKGLLENKTGNVKIKVDPPAKIDYSGNSPTQNGGNPAGQTKYNLCFSLTNWAIFVVYEHDEKPEKTVILKDGIVLAWDYHFIHKGEWRRPKVTFEHGPVKPENVNFYLFGSGSKAGSALPGANAMDQICSCGCGGGFYLLPGPTAKNPFKFPVADQYMDPVNDFWSNIHSDPASVLGDYMHRDKTNGPWHLKSNGGTLYGAQPINGNDWTRFQSGDRYTDFPNLFEGEVTQADNITPVTNENWPTMAKPTAGNIFGYTAAEVYNGHPWGESGDVEYLGWGNATNVLKVKVRPERIDPVAGQSALYFKADQKDVFKPQANLIINFLAIEVEDAGPVNLPPVVAINNLSDGEQITGIKNIEIEAQDDGAVVKVECSLNGVIFAQDQSAPYTCGVNMADYFLGNHDLSVTATDDQGKTTTVTVRIFGGEKPDNTPPQVILSAPLQGGNFLVNQGVLFIAEADDDVAVEKVEFYVNDLRIGAASSSPYQFTWTPSATGSYAVHALALDKAGNGTTSAPVSITVSALPPCQEWTVSNQQHVSEGRAETYYYGVYARTIGSGEDLGFYYSGNSTVKQTSPGYYEKGACSSNQEKVMKPVFSVAGGTYSQAVEVGITSSTAGASIYYTLDGSAPTASSLSYTGPLTISASKTLKAIAIKSGYTPSDITTASYVIEGSSNCAQWTATNYQHVALGRAETYTSWFSTYARTKGAKQDLGSYGTSYYSPTTTVRETSPGYFEKGSCP